MEMKFQTLTLQCRKSREVIEFSPQVSYFHGQISAGKSSIMRLIDYCLGGDLERTPAILKEMVSVELSATISDKQVLFERHAQSLSHVQVTWRDERGRSGSVLAPIDAGQNPIWQYDVFNLSDLIFYLNGITPIKVRKSKYDEDTSLVRLSFRDVMWYCYLDQDNLDSSFYWLKHPFKDMKSRDAMRFITGFYTERMNDLEIQLDEARQQRMAKTEAAKQIRSFLQEYGYGTESDVAKEIGNAENELVQALKELSVIRQEHTASTHFVDELRGMLRDLSDQLAHEEQALADLCERIKEQESLKAELLSGKFKLARAESASAVLSGVSFKYCPSCGSDLSDNPPADSDVCRLCGRIPTVPKDDTVPQAEIVRIDLNSRIEDLTESIEKHTEGKSRQERLIAKIKEKKATLDTRLTEELASYDSAFLARSRELERRVATLEERKRGLEKTAQMLNAVSNLEKEVSQFRAREDELKQELLVEKSKLTEAEKRIIAIQDAYLEALLKSHVPGVSEDDTVSINRNTWIPWIYPKEGDGYSFFNAGSGGKKTLLNVCYALAVHRVAAEHRLPLPKFLMIDTPMKNIGEDVNADIFRSFYMYLYDLAQGPLSSTQFIIIDKEYIKPSEGPELQVVEKFMSPDFPLISYYRGP